MATALLIAFFLSLQIGSALHEVHEDEDHRGHDCVACQLVTEDAEYEMVAADDTEPVFKFEIAQSDGFQYVVITTAVKTHQSRAPPPRGPPATRTKI